MVLSFLLEYKFIILFYLFIVAFFYWKRKSVERQAGFIFLYRMKWGLKWMDRYAKSHREWIILLGYIGAGTGFIGLLVISYVLFKNLWDLVVSTDVVSGVSLVLPGVNVPGVGVLPFWYWLIAIFIIALVHEFAHGVVARAHNIGVKHTGIVLFGPILGAFVEPDEETLRKQSDIKQYSVLAAGAFANVLLALGALVLLLVAFNPALNAMTEPSGFSFSAYAEGDFPFEQAGISPGAVVSEINGVETLSFQDFSSELSYYRPGEEISVVADGEQHNLVLGANPDDEKKAFLGVTGITNEFEVVEKFNAGAESILYAIISWLAGLMRWLFLLSFGIGLFNLLPLPIVDGGRMVQVFLHKLQGEKKGDKNYYRIGMFFLVVLLLNLFYPLLRQLF